MDSFKRKLEQEGKGKSNVQYLLEWKPGWKPGKKTEYVYKLTGNQVSIVFQTRTRMIKVKGKLQRTKEPHMQSMQNRGRNTAAHTRRMRRTTLRWVNKCHWRTYLKKMYTT